MRRFILALTLSLAAFAAAAAETTTPDSENGRYSFHPLADGVLRLDTRTGQVSQCSRSDVVWACKVVPDERSALETEIGRLGREIAILKKEFLAHGLALPGAPSEPTPKPGEPELKLPSDAEVRQGHVVPREGLASSDRDGEDPSEGRREAKLKPDRVGSCQSSRASS